MPIFARHSDHDAPLAATRGASGGLAVGAAQILRWNFIYVGE